jgi:hypothetical protein
MEELKIPYMVVGSVASSIYGYWRTTADIDVVADLHSEDVPGLCEKFPPPEYYVSPEAAIQAIRAGGQFNIIRSTTAEKIDIMVARRDAWGKMQLARRRPVRALEDRDVDMASPEDVIIAKLLYCREGGSEKHLQDIAGILKVIGSGIDRAYIDRWAAELGLADLWQEALRLVGR